VLQKRKESRKRNLSIHLPAAIPLTPTLRLVAIDNTYLTLQDVFDEHCREKKMLRDKPMLSFIDKFRQLYHPSGNRPEDYRRDVESVEYKVARMEVVEEIAMKYVPEDVLTKVSRALVSR
jgi:transformation/transcription domain-associated protein